MELISNIYIHTTRRSKRSKKKSFFLCCSFCFMILLLLLVLQTFLWFQMENYVCVREKTTRKRQKNSVHSFWFGNLVENNSKWKRFWSEIHKYSSVTIQSIVEEKILKFQNDQRTFRNNSIFNHPFWICACYVVCVVIHSPCSMD